VAAPPVAAEFLAWQAAVKNYTGFGKKEALHSVVLRRELSPVLRGDIEEFRFSPDGKYVLAQDNATIFVITRNPFEVAFKIRAPEAHKAQFSPDSAYVVFYNDSLRVERWNVAERHLQDISEPYVFGGCAQTELSPDGAFLACMRPNRETYFPMDLQLYQVSDGSTVLVKKSFVGPAEFGYNTYLNFVRLFSGHHRLIAMAFSPDGRYFIASRSSAHLLFDLKAKAEVPMPGGLKKYTSFNFAFVGPDRILGTSDATGENATLVKMPSGDVLDDNIPLGGRTVYPASKGDYAIVRPLAKAPVGVLDLKSKKIVIGSRTDALDIFDGQFVNERVNGEVGIYATAGQPPIATAQLPRAAVAGVSAAIASDNLGRMALSESTRGAVWDLNSGERLFYVRGFRGASFDGDGMLFTFTPADQFSGTALKGEKSDDVRKREMQQPGDTIGRADFATKSITPVVEVLKRTSVRQIGPVVLSSTARDDDQPRKNVKMEAKDARTGNLLWSREYPSAPTVHTSVGNQYVVFSWFLGSGGAKEELKDDPEAKKLVNALKDTEGSYLVEVVEPGSGKIVAKFPISTGRASFHAQHMRATGDTLMLVDNNHRVMLYSIRGEPKGRLFGGYAVLSKDGSKLAVEREPGRVFVYDTVTLREADQFTFGGEIVTAQFSSDSSRLFVLTDDETAIVLNLADGKPEVTTVGAK
jgi:WD40 repeat protein